MCIIKIIKGAGAIMKIEIYENVGKTTATLLLKEKGFTKDVEFIELKEISKN